MARRSDEVYEYLREEIVEGRMPEVHPLNEVELAQRIGTSRTPVREALMRLAHEGLVQTVPGKGWMVTQMSLRDVVELFQVREALETLAVRLCAEEGDPAAFAVLADRFAALHPTDSDGLIAAVSDLDEALLVQCKNSRLAASLREIINHRMRIRAMSGRRTSRLASANLEHVRICRAIANRDAETAVRETRAHIRQSLQTVLDALLEEARGQALRA